MIFLIFKFIAKHAPKLEHLLQDEDDQTNKSDQLLENNKMEYNNEGDKKEL